MRVSSLCDVKTRNCICLSAKKTTLALIIIRGSLSCLELDVWRWRNVNTLDLNDCNFSASVQSLSCLIEAREEKRLSRKNTLKRLFLDEKGRDSWQPDNTLLVSRKTSSNILVFRVISWQTTPCSSSSWNFATRKSINYRDFFYRKRKEKMTQLTLTEGKTVGWPEWASYDESAILLWESVCKEF